MVLGRFCKHYLPIIPEFGMPKSKRAGKSDKYAGVYWREVMRLDGLGMERAYYICYRRGGRGSKQIEEPLGRASQGWNEAKANRERAARIAGKSSNAEARERERKERFLGSEPLTIKRLWQLYYEAHTSNRSIRDDVNRYNRHIDPVLGKLPASELQTSKIEAFRRKLEKTGLAPQSVKHCLALVKRIVRYALKIEALTLPQQVIFEMPLVNNVKTETMNREQLAAYLQALAEEEDQNLAALFRLALVTGLRKGALFGLRWQDCDFENRLITLQAKYAKNKKTSTIPMNDEAVRILSGIVRISEFVFPGQDGGKRTTIAKMARRVREKAGLPASFRPLHGLRHVFASELANSGKVSLQALQQLMTHGSAAMTQRYSHLADEALRRAANVANTLAGDSQ